MFYALVTDLVGASQEPIDPDDGSVAGWVYNRFRFYDPWSGVYGSQDPLGVVPNPATPYGYVGNPVLWVDPDALKACPKVLTNAIVEMMHTVDNIAAVDPRFWEGKRGLNVAGMVDMDGNIYYAMGARENMQALDFPGLNVVGYGTKEELAVLTDEELLMHHAEQRLFRKAKELETEIVAIHSGRLAPFGSKWQSLVRNGMWNGMETCRKILNDAGLKSVDNYLFINPKYDLDIGTLLSKMR